MAHLSARGKKMAESLAEYVMMKHFFGYVDHKKQASIRQAFVTDMQFCLPRGHITKATTCFNKRSYLVSLAYILSKCCRKRSIRFSTRNKFRCPAR